MCHHTQEDTVRVCCECGFDSSADREQYPTLVRAKSVMPSKRGLLLKDQKELQRQVQTLREENAAMKQKLENLYAGFAALTERVQRLEAQERPVQTEVYTEPPRQEPVEPEKQEPEEVHPNHGLFGRLFEDTTKETDAVAVKSGKCGQSGAHVKWTLYDNGLLQINGNGAMKDYDLTSGAPWKKFKDQIKQVEVKVGVIKIGCCAFQNCKELRSVKLANTVQEIRGNAFDGCECLEEIQLPRTIQEIGMNAFGGCKKLTQIKLPTGLKKLQIDTFAYCGRLKHVILPEGLEEIGVNAFANCRALENIHIPLSVKEIHPDAFRNCPAKVYKIY